MTIYSNQFRNGDKLYFGTFCLDLLYMETKTPYICIYGKQVGHIVHVHVL